MKYLPGRRMARELKSPLVGKDVHATLRPLLADSSHSSLGFWPSKVGSCHLLWPNGGGGNCRVQFRAAQHAPQCPIHLLSIAIQPSQLGPMARIVPVTGRAQDSSLAEGQRVFKLLTR